MARPMGFQQVQDEFIAQDKFRQADEHRQSELLAKVLSVALRHSAQAAQAVVTVAAVHG